MSIVEQNKRGYDFAKREIETLKTPRETLKYLIKKDEQKICEMRAWIEGMQRALDENK